METIKKWIGKGIDWVKKNPGKAIAGVASIAAAVGYSAPAWLVPALQGAIEALGGK